MTNIATEIGVRIKAVRKTAALSQSELAARIDKKLRTVQKYESGEIEPSISTIFDIAKVLNVSPAFLIGCSDSTTTEFKAVSEEPPPDPGRYLCIWKGLDWPDGLMDVLNYNGSYFPWERVYTEGRVVVTHWMPLPARSKEEE